MKAAFVLLLSLSHSVAFAQDVAAPSSASLPEAAQQEAALPVAPAAFDGRAYWARFDAEQAARQAQQDSVDVRTPKILTLCLLASAATLLLTAAVSSLFQWSPAGPFALLPSHSGQRRTERGHVNPANYWLAGAGGALALGAIGAGVWWRQRRDEQTRLKRGLASASSETRLRGPALTLRVSTESFALMLSGRL